MENFAASSYSTSYADCHRGSCLSLPPARTAPEASATSLAVRRVDLHQGLTTPSRVDNLRV